MYNLDDFDDLMEAMWEGVVECPECGDSIELDGICACGGESPFLELGLI